MAKFICWTCKEEFEKPESELKRNEERGRRNFCSRRCTGKSSHKHLEIYYGKNNTNLKVGSTIDEYTGLRAFVRSSKKRKCLSFINKEDLLEIWERQKGICPYTGINLLKPSSKKVNCKIHTASLDRIDSAGDYTKENVQFISMAVNLMKSTMSHEQTVELCKIIANHWNKNNELCLQRN